jgi:hypothetical protein
MVLTIAALMAAMMVSAGPAKADVSFGGSSVDVDVGDGFGFDVGDGFFGFDDVGDGFFGFDVGDGDDDDADGFTNRVFFVQSNSELDDFEPEGIAFV